MIISILSLAFLRLRKEPSYQHHCMLGSVALMRIYRVTSNVRDIARTGRVNYD